MLTMMMMMMPRIAILVAACFLWRFGSCTPVNCCAAISASIGSGKVFTPNATSYQNTSASYFAQQEGELSPSCYVRPASREDVSSIVTTLFQLNSNSSSVCPFAVRGGGHHTVVGIANINNGITIDLAYLNQTTLSEDKTIASIGPGARWGSVYSTLVPQGLAVLGGRESDIGVGGFTAAGGISYFPRYGFGCDLVRNFEIVLANGTIANVNSRESPDIFTALKGAGNNLGIVTRFDLQTFSLGQYFGGEIFYLPIETPALISAFTAFVANPQFDNNASMLLSILYTSLTGYLTLATPTYAQPVADPPVFVNFTHNIPALIDETSVSNLSYFAEMLGGSETPDGLRQTSITATVKPDDSLLQHIYHLWIQTVTAILSAQNLVVSLTMQPLTFDMLKAGPLNGGNVLGLDSSQGPLVVLVLTVQYTSAQSDDIIARASRKLFSDIDVLAKQTGDSIAFKYLNYADVTQDVINSYGPANVQKLQAASKSVDPTGFLQKVQPGGFKLF